MQELTGRDYIRAAIVILVIATVLAIWSLNEQSKTEDLTNCYSQWVETDTGAVLQYVCD